MRILPPYLPRVCFPACFQEWAGGEKVKNVSLYLAGGEIDGTSSPYGTRWLGRGGYGVQLWETLGILSMTRFTYSLPTFSTLRM